MNAPLLSAGDTRRRFRRFVSTSAEKLNYQSCATACDVGAGTASESPRLPKVAKSAAEQSFSPQTQETAAKQIRDLML